MSRAEYMRSYYAKHKRRINKQRRIQRRKKPLPDKHFWLTPPEMYAALDAEFRFDFDPCPWPRPDDFDGIVAPWGWSNYVNPPYRRSDAAFGAGPTAFARKAIAEMALGKSSVLVLPTVSYVNLLLQAGAECRSLGRPRWVETESGATWESPSCVTAFILRANGNRP